MGHHSLFTKTAPWSRRRAMLRPKMKTYRLAARALQRSGCEVTTSTGHTLRTGLPVRVGGDDEAPQPVEMLVAALLGCKTATAHFVARHLWPRPHNRIGHIEFVDVIAERDERGALSLPIATPAPVTSQLSLVQGIARVTPVAGASLRSDDVRELGRLVEERCPVAAMMRASGCALCIEWTLALAGAKQPDPDQPPPRCKVKYGL